MDANIARRLVDSHPHWHHRFEIFPGVITNGTYGPDTMLSRLQLPLDLSGCRALDIGASDGFFSRELHRRGATVTAIDYRPKDVSGFAVMERIYGHEFEFIHANISELEKLDLAPFDIVLFLGVLYHLPDPIRALHQVRGLCKGTLFLETYVELFDEDQPSARYYPADTLVGDNTNFWAPNPAAVQGFLEDTGFVVDRLSHEGDRCVAVAHGGPESIKMRQAYGRL